MGTINVFLGGSGKYLAEELKGLRAHYELPLPEFIAFDLSRESTHTGAFALGHDLLAPHEQFATTTKEETAPAWVDLDAGRGLTPQPPQPGPRWRPEAAVMSQIAEQMQLIEPPSEGLWGLRAAGLLAFATFMDPEASGPESEAALRFKDRVQHALRGAGRDGSQITMNIVASTAGGTGAGIFMPLAWWLHDHPDVTSLEINLVLVTSSAFDNEPLDSGVDQREMRTKGRAGTFAIIRELEFLESVDSQTRFPYRRFPIATGNPEGVLRYRPGSSPFHRVYWMGRRATDVGANKVDVYRETDPLIRILSNREASNDLDGQTGTYARRLLPSVVTIDYPRLARARRMSSDLAEAALRQLIEGENHPVSGRRFFQFPGDNPGAFGKFLQVNENRTFATDLRGDTNTTARAVDDLVKPYTDVRPHRLDYAGIATGVERARSGYSASDDDWRAYCASLANDLKQRWTQHEKRIDQRTRERIRDEADLFRNFVTRVAAEYLNPSDLERGPYPLSSLRTQIRDLKDDLGIIKTFFGHSRGIQGRLPSGDAQQARFAAIDGISQRIAAQESAMLRPREPKTSAGLTSGSWLILLLATAVAAAVGWFVGIAFPGPQPLPWGVAAVAALVTALVAYGTLKRRGGTPLPELRRQEERRLFHLYEDRVFANAGQALLQAVNESFVPRAQEALEALDSRAAELGEVYAELLTNARARASEVFAQARHSVGQVGSELSAPEIQSPDFLDPLTNSIRVDTQATEDARIRDLLFIIRSSDGSASNGFVGEMAGDIRERRQQERGEQFGAASRGGLDLAGIDAAIDSAATTSLARHLPRTFEDALSRETGQGNLAALDGYLAALIHKTPGGTPLQGQDRRRSSVDCNKRDATVKRLYVPSVEVQALVVRSVQEGEGGTLARAVSEELMEYMGPDGRPLVVPELGASIALLSLWVPDVGDQTWAPTSIMATHEGQRAHDTYFSATPEAKALGFIGQHERNFQIIPELSAAAAIEAERFPVRPLLPCVSARLLGSHPKQKGPTLLELFYLLRAHGSFHRASSEDPINRREYWEIVHPRQQIPIIDQPILVGTSGSSDSFGGGRRIVNAFDAFQEFMLYDGALPSVLVREPWLFVDPIEATLRSNDWAAIEKSDLAEVQRWLVQRWWDVESREVADLEFAKMLDILREDQVMMDEAEASEDWHRAVEQVLKSGHQKRRALAPGAS